MKNKNYDNSNLIIDKAVDVSEEEPLNSALDDSDHTLDHQPVLSEDMKLFSYSHEHDEHLIQKLKNKIKAFFSYFVGGVSVLSLSIFGFISSDSHDGSFSADIVSQEMSCSVENISTKNCCLEVLNNASDEIQRKKIESSCDKFLPS